MKEYDNDMNCAECKYSRESIIMMNFLILAIIMLMFAIVFYKS